FRKVLGPEHDDTLIAMQGVATLYDAVLRRDDALKMREEVLALRRKASGPEHPATLWAMNNLAASYRTADRRDEAIKVQEEVVVMFGEAVPIARKGFRDDSVSMGAILCGFGLAKLRYKAFAEAEPPLREGLAIMQKVMPDGFAPLFYQSDLGAALLGLKGYA